ncbi:MAG: DUF3429 domain-containing protein [Lautropia sp.]
MSAPRRLAIGLGVGGLVPFVALAACVRLDAATLSALFAGTPLGPGFAVVGQLQHMLSVYAVAILSFVGALHWGFVLAAPERVEGQASRGLVWSVMPALYGWIVVSLIDLPRAFGWLAAGFAFAFAADVVLYPRYAGVPAWFVRLRLLLSVVAALALATAFTAA